MSEYYDSLAPYYKLMYFDWEKSVERQAANLDSIIKEYIGGDKSTLLDAACGIGTQSIGLARKGYQVTASDLSPGEIDVAREEAVSHGVMIDFSVADIRSLWKSIQKQFDIVIACDNAIPHLLKDEEILLAFKQFFACTKPGGGCIISVRDYTDLEHPQSGTRLYPRQIHQLEDSRIIVFDLWEFQENLYSMSTYMVTEKKDFSTSVKVINGGKYYCVPISILEELLTQAGYSKVFTLRNRFFQPVILALKPE